MILNYGSIEHIDNIGQKLEVGDNGVIKVDNNIELECRAQKIRNRISLLFFIFCIVVMYVEIYVYKWFDYIFPPSVSYILWFVWMSTYMLIPRIIKHKHKVQKTYKIAKIELVLYNGLECIKFKFTDSSWVIVLSSGKPFIKKLIQVAKDNNIPVYHPEPF